ncbi:MAG: hypothetical protein ACOC2W_01930 [bacterium]
MEDKLKRLLYLSEYRGDLDKKKINEKVDFLLESKRTEQEATNILTKNNIQNPERIVNQFKEVDQTKNQILLPIMSKYLVDSGGYHKLNDTLELFDTISEFVNSGKLKTPQIVNNNYVVNNKTFSNPEQLSNYVKGLEHMTSGHKELTGKIQNVKGDEKPIETGDNIEVYDGNDVGKCIKYTTGGLTGKHYEFCIGQPANTYWQSYRDSKTSTFYYVVDKNRELDDPLHIVVVDHTQHGFELTDENDNTGHIAEYGTDVNGYFDYLESKGVDTSVFEHKPKTPEEEELNKKIGVKNENLDWFKDLSYEEKSKYIGRGHLLSDEQFEYLWQFHNSDGGFKLLHQYLDTGQPIPVKQYNILIGKEKVTS